jgi:protein-S-isoprenylcysteine O-methyltransferase Ste14
VNDASAAYTPIHWRELLLGRVAPIAAFCLLLIAQISHIRGELAVAGQRGLTPTAILTDANAALLLAYYALLMGLYLVRLPPSATDRRPSIIVASFAGTFLIMGISFLPSAPRRDWLLLPSDLLTLAGILYSLWSLLFLRRSFSILPQARELVTGGPYALSRNPLYVGESVGAWSVFLPTIGWAGVLVLALNLALQVVRVFAEERVLARTFGAAYADYLRTVPRFIPRPWRLFRKSPSPLAGEAR